MKALLINPAGVTKQYEVPMPLLEVRVPLFLPISAMFATVLRAEPLRISYDVYQLVPSIERTDGKLLVYEWVRTESHEAL